MILNSVKTIFSLMKYKVSMAVTFTAITSYTVFTGYTASGIIKLALAIFILAGGSSALNEYKERKYDAKMDRTKNRPIPSGKISPKNAFLVSVLLIILGVILLYSFFGLITALLGLFNIIWYNLLYTNLKRLTPYAVVPGSLVGAIPAFMGWTAGGGFIFESTIVFIAFFLFIWQIPHFWLLMLKYGKEYEEAGFPTINQQVQPANLKIIIFSWIVATSLSSFLVPLYLIEISFPFLFAIFVLNIIFISVFAKISFGKVKELNFRKSFMSINIYMLVFMIMLIIYHLSAS